MKRNIHNRLIAFIVCASLLIALVGFQSVYGQTDGTKTGTVSDEVTSYLNVRTGPGTDNSKLTDSNGNSVFLTAGETVTIMGTYKSTDGGSQDWYKISFTFGGKTMTGYVRSDFIDVTVPPVEGELSEDFEESIKAFPDSYKPYLRTLHISHPDWTFKAFNTGLDWNEVVKNETVLGRSLTSSSILSYRSTAEGAYDWSNDRYISLDGAGWYQAADDVVKYYLDPRNFLNEKNMFQFEALYYDSKAQTVSGIETMLSGTFMDGTYIDKGSSQITYAQAFVDAAKESGVSPYHLISRVIQEVGRQGSRSTSGMVSGYEGIYNYYNIGATSGSDPVVNGLRFAKTGGNLSSSSKTKYLIPWDSRYKSIVGGAKYIGSNYISIGQNTLYLQKFDVDSSDGSLYWHQYMTNISAAVSESTTMYNTYKELGILNGSITFSIPVFKNMPSSNCNLPEAKGNPNNLLKSLSVKGYSITPTFEIESENSTYYLILEGNIKSITVNASAVSSSASVSGNINSVSLSQGINDLKINVKAQNGDVKTYRLVVVLNDGDFKPGDEGTTKPTTTEPPTEPGTEKPTVTEPSQPQNQGCKTNYKFRDSALITGIQTQTSISGFISNLGLYGGATAYVTDADGRRVTSGYVGTGYILRMTVNGKESKYTVVIRGDTNGDGEINAVDLLMVRKSILKVYDLNGSYYTAGDTNNDGEVNAVDLLMIRKHILKTYTIEQ